MSVPRREDFRQAFRQARPRQLIRQLSRYRFGEYQGPDILGGLVQRFDDPKIKLALARQAWDESQHAYLLTQRILELGGDPYAYTPSEINKAIFKDLLFTDSSADRLAVLHAYEAHFAELCALHMREAPDPSTQFMLRRILLDEQQHLRNIGGIMDVVIKTPEERKRTREVEAIVDDAVTRREAYELEPVFLAP